MQRITLLCVGSLKTQWIAAGCEDFLSRLQKSSSFELVEVPASKQKDSAKQKEEESAKLLDALGKREGVVWVFDETGKQCTSQSFAQEIEKLSDRGESLTCVIGGAYGLTDEMKSKASKLVALSEMTFTHEMARLFLVEQLYRASEIRRGSGYHH